MGDSLPRLIRDAASARLNVSRPSNRAIADLADLSPGTIDRIMRGEGTPDVGTIDKIADAIGIPRAVVRTVAQLPRGETGPYEPPDESRLLSERQRKALDALIRSLVISYQRPFETIEQLLNYLTPTELTELSEKARQMVEEFEADLDRVYRQPIDIAWVNEKFGILADADEWWMDDVATLGRTYLKLERQWGDSPELMHTYIEALESVPNQGRPSADYQYEMAYEIAREWLLERDSRRNAAEGPDGVRDE